MGRNGSKGTSAARRSNSKTIVRSRCGFGGGGAGVVGEGLALRDGGWGLMEGDGQRKPAGVSKEAWYALLASKQSSQDAPTG